ncbi:hypothetical protein [Morganella morganii]|uniref:hypothetical protein n=1 Tax=Morganella morganii TaxID=582 RepID=UPI0034D66545
MNKILSISFSLTLILSTFYYTTSFSFYGFSLYGPIILTIIMTPFVKRIKNKSLYILIIPFIAVLSYLLSKGHILDEDINNIKINSLIIITWGSLLFILTSGINEVLKSGTLDSIVKYTILIHISISLSQLILWYLFGIDLDISSIFNGQGHRPHYYGIYRITGVFDEPAIYSIFIVSLCFIRYYLSGKNDIVNYIALLTVFISISFIGIIIAALYLIISTTIKKSISFTLVIIFCFLILNLIYPEIIDSISNRISALSNGSDGSTNFKYLYLTFWMDDIHRILFGNGFVGYFEGKPQFFESTFDLSFIITAITTFGVILAPPLLITFYFLIFKNQSVRIKLLILVISLKLATIVLPFFWLFIGIIFSYEKIKNNSR